MHLNGILSRTRRKQLFISFCKCTHDQEIMAIVLVFYSVVGFKLKRKTALKMYSTLITEHFINSRSYIQRRGFPSSFFSLLPLDARKTVLYLSMERLFVSSIAGENTILKKQIKDQTSSVERMRPKNFSDGWLEFYAPR